MSNSENRSSKGGTLCSHEFGIAVKAGNGVELAPMKLSFLSVILLATSLYAESPVSLPDAAQELIDAGGRKSLKDFPKCRYPDHLVAHLDQWSQLVGQYGQKLVQLVPEQLRNDLLAIIPNELENTLDHPLDAHVKTTNTSSRGASPAQSNPARKLSLPNDSSKLDRGQAAWRL